MKYSSAIIAIATLVSSVSLRADESFREQFANLSVQEQRQVRAEATQKEDYDQMPSVPSKLNRDSVVEFCKLLPRGLETLATQTFEASNRTESERTRLWSQYISCKDSLLYYEGHRFFGSQHYTEAEVRKAISEIKTVMDWLVKQEKSLDSQQPGYSKAY